MHDALEWYASAYDFVEVNSTFYTIPGRETVASWRGRVPESFEFTVKAHRELTHVNRLSPKRETHEIFEKMKNICEILRSEILVMETPPNFDVGENLEDIQDFLCSLNPRNLRIAWEMRCYGEREVPPRVAELMREHHIIHCVDYSTSKPSFESDVTYTRLFGRGKGNIYQFTDKELADINSLVEETGSKRKYMNFHGVRMYKDAARMILFKKTGRFPKVTKSVGQKSLEEVLTEDARFPASKRELLESQGWKVFDKTDSLRVRVSEAISGIPERIYADIEDVMNQMTL
jgi:uncharacterized protein YecE (DUF72 family)